MISLKPLSPGVWEFTLFGRTGAGVIVNDILLKYAETDNHKVLLRVKSISYLGDSERGGEALDIVYHDQITPEIARLVSLEDKSVKIG